MKDLILGARRGRPGAKEKILARTRPLIMKNIRTYPNYREDFEDLYQDGLLEVLEGLEDFEPDLGVPFLAYISLRLTYLYLNKYEGVDIFSLNEKLKNSDQEKIDLLPADDNTEEEVMALDNNLGLYRALEGLTPRQVQVVELYYFRGRTMPEISRMLGISYRTVINTKVNAIKYLRKTYNKL